MPMEIQVLTWDRLKQVAGLNWLMGSQSYPSGEFDLVTTTTAVNTIPKYNWKTKHSILQFTIKKLKKQ
jgi:hypothetical protein